MAWDSPQTWGYNRQTIREYLNMIPNEWPVLRLSLVLITWRRRGRRTP